MSNTVDCLPLSIIEKYLGVPWKAQGTSPEGWECWGLVKYVLETHFEAKVPYQYEQAWGDVAKTIESIDKGRRDEGWVQVYAPIDGDVVIMGPSFFCHVGVFIKGKCLHVMNTAGTCWTELETLKRYGYKRMEFYRWQP